MFMYNCKTVNNDYYTLYYLVKVKENFWKSYVSTEIYTNIGNQVIFLMEQSIMGIIVKYSCTKFSLFVE